MKGSVCVFDFGSIDVEFSSVSGVNQTIKFVEILIRLNLSQFGLLSFVLDLSSGKIFLFDLGVQVSNLDTLL
jgi:hypothetical protein